MALPARLDEAAGVASTSTRTRAHAGSAHRSGTQSPPSCPTASKLLGSHARVATATAEGLAVVADVWRSFSPAPTTHRSETRERTRLTLERLREGDLMEESVTEQDLRLITRSWTFPLHGVDLRRIDVDPKHLRDVRDHSLRLGGKQRVWGGVRQGHVFFPIWWDPEHTVCPRRRREARRTRGLPARAPRGCLSRALRRRDDHEVPGDGVDDDEADDAADTEPGGPEPVRDVVLGEPLEPDLQRFHGRTVGSGRRAGQPNDERGGPSARSGATVLSRLTRSRRSSARPAPGAVGVRLRVRCRPRRATATTSAH